MAVTLRQMQRWLHASKQNPTSDFAGDSIAEVGQFAGWLRGDSTSHGVIRNGKITSGCDCEHCSQTPLVDARVSSLVDSLAKKHGANTLLSSLYAESPPEGFKNPDGDDEDDKEKSGESPEQPGQSGQGDGEGSDNNEPADESEAESRPSQKESPQQAALREITRKGLQAAKAALQKLQEEMKAQPDSALAKKQIKTVKKALKNARRAASFGTGSGPSLETRKQIAGAHGRLQKVSPALRAEMAALINLLVGQGKAAGGQMGPIPVLSPKRLVTRMLARRPLANALKEDIVTGRPVTLFLPDISPSCEAQAQAACDVANAAGYSGVSGSDVLVFPHSNGFIDEYADEYVPWFNGKPYTTDRPTIARLFDEVTTGKGKWRVRAVVIIGDHDGASLYSQIADLKRIARMIWLHNEQCSSSRQIEMAEQADRRLHGWQPASERKVSMVYGCVTQPHMVKGLKMALQSS